jgi:uncharacterized protein YfaS (alpha-2-macroglobulin family)
MAFNIKQNDTSPSLQAILKDASGTAIILTAASVRFHMKALDGTVKVDAAMTVTDNLNGVVQYDWQTGDTDTVGSYSVEFEVTYLDNTIETFPNNQNLTISVVRELN